MRSYGTVDVLGMDVLGVLGLEEVGMEEGGKEEVAVEKERRDAMKRCRVFRWTWTDWGLDFG